MILWIILFLLVIAISFVLAYSSMRDYQEVPRNVSRDFGIYLVRATNNLTSEILESIHKQMVSEGLIVSIERLFKGNESALVLFGPKKVLQNFVTVLNLIELEDYAKANDHQVAWEVGVKDPHHFQVSDINDFFQSFPLLSEKEQLWWQLTLQAKKTNPPAFYSQIRSVVVSEHPKRREEIAKALQNLADGKLTKVPKPFTSSQIVQFYQMRSVSKGENNPTLTTDDVLRLTLLS